MKSTTEEGQSGPRLRPINRSQMVLRPVEDLKKVRASKTNSTDKQEARARLRGMIKVGMETLWACLTYNIKQWIRLCSKAQWA